MVRNNLVTDLDVTSGTGMVEDHNLVMTDPASFFVDVTTHDFHLVPGAAAIDVGSADLAPAWSTRASVSSMQDHAAMAVASARWMAARA